MNTKILASFLIIGLVASAIGMGTYAFFSDTETSTGNTFTAGSIDLKIDLDRDGSNVWVLKDLVAGTDKFFTYSDVKPGDDGELTVSLHVYSNDAYGCFYIDPYLDTDNTCTEPELEVETGCTPAGDGELDDHLQFRIWLDQGCIPGWQCAENDPHCTTDPHEGDNNWDKCIEIGPPEPFLTYCGSTGSAWCYLSDIDEDGEVWLLGTLTGSKTNYIGIEWNLPGATTGNAVQSDNWGANVAFYAEQTKNNGGFSCPSIDTIFPQ